MLKEKKKKIKERKEKPCLFRNLDATNYIKAHQPVFFLRKKKEEKRREGEKGEKEERKKEKKRKERRERRRRKKTCQSGQGREEEEGPSFV